MLVPILLPRYQCFTQPSIQFIEYGSILKRFCDLVIFSFSIPVHLKLQAASTKLEASSDLILNNPEQHSNLSG